MSNVALALLSCSLFSIVGCVSIDPALIRELAKDTASLCVATDVRGGVGSLAGTSGGYGQGTFMLCRSNQPNATLSIEPDGKMSVQNGAE